MIDDQRPLKDVTYFGPGIKLPAHYYRMLDTLSRDTWCGFEDANRPSGTVAAAPTDGPYVFCIDAFRQVANLAVERVMGGNVPPNVIQDVSRARSDQAWVVAAMGDEYNHTMITYRGSSGGECRLREAFFMADDVLRAVSHPQAHDSMLSVADMKHYMPNSYARYIERQKQYWELGVAA